MALLLTAPPQSLAQSKDKTTRIGLLVAGSYPPRSHFEQALLAGLREQGYIEGENLVLERRYAGGKRERLLEFAREFVDIEVDAVVTTCTPSTRAAKQSTASTPIVMAAVADPVGQKLIASLARPGTNITGLSRGGKASRIPLQRRMAGVTRGCRGLTVNSHDAFDAPFSGGDADAAVSMPGEARHLRRFQIERVPEQQNILEHRIWVIVPPQERFGSL